MKFFNEKPLFRLCFFAAYITAAICGIIDFTFPGILFSLVMLFCCYVTLVKAGILKNEFISEIKSSGFDFISVALSVIIIIDVIKIIINALK